MSWLTDLQVQGSGLSAEKAGEITAFVYFNRLQNWDKFKSSAVL